MATSKLTPDQCASIVMETVPPVTRFIRSEMRRHGAPGLSMPQFRALAFLSRCPGASLSAVAEHLGVTLSTASTITDRLVRHDLLDRVPHPDERRRVSLTLTPAGARLLDQARAATRTRIAEMLDGLSPDQMGAIVEGLTVLSDAIKGGVVPESSGAR